MNLRFLALAAVPALSIAACMTDAGPADPVGEDLDPPIATAISTTGRCQLWGCGANSATVGDGIVFDELDASMHYQNKGGVQITYVQTKDGRSGKLAIARHEMYAVSTDPATAGREYHWADLVGTIITLKQTVGKDSVMFQLQVTATGATSFWRGDFEKVPFYDIKARKIGDLTGKFTERICRNNVVGEDPRWNDMPYQALAFQWDHYDAAAKTVSQDTSPTNPWFNLACAGTAPAKMHLQRYTYAGGLFETASPTATPRYPSTLDQRQALLKMFTADYCGTGVNYNDAGEDYTVDGTPLIYTNRDGSMTDSYPLARSVASSEAAWSAAGAACLDTPRYIVARSHVACAATLPACNAKGWTFPGVSILSSNPVR